MTTGEESDNKNLAYYRKCFSQINVGNNPETVKALYQPILLMSVTDLIAQGLIKENKITISDELTNTFNKYLSVLSPNSSKNVSFSIAFFHLNNKKPPFWYVKFNEGYEGKRAQSITKLKRNVDSAELDEELFNLLQDSNARKELIDELLSVWFSSKNKQIEDILKINQSFHDSTLDELDTIESGNTDRQPKVYFKKSVFREAVFRKSIVQLYDYRCAFCRLKVTRSLRQSIVDGAHIKPFSEFYDNRLDNGLSLCKNHHWAFDRGWWAVDDRYQIIVASDLQEDSPHARLMKEFHGELILLPSLEKDYPRKKALQWHRKNVCTLNQNGALENE
ncbi:MULTISPECIES: HNH endonuclease [unclassified Microcoleus]|uniref:HNH endonuclease n=1 Tax=unclassified Microcoleus TaxID=2642155 RepID=UPI002FD5F601